MANWRTMKRLADQILHEQAQQTEPSIFDAFQTWKAQTWYPYWQRIKPERETTVLDEEHPRQIRFKCGLQTVQGQYIRLGSLSLHEIQNKAIPGKSHGIHPHYLTAHDPAAADPVIVFMLDVMYSPTGDPFVLKHCPEIRPELHQLRQWQQTATMIEIIQNYSLSHLLYVRSPRFRHCIDTYMDLGQYRNLLRGQIRTIAALHLPPFFTLEWVDS